MFLSNDNGALQTQMNNSSSNPIASVHANSQISMHQHQQHQQQQQQQQQQLGQSQRMTLQQQPYSIQVRHSLTHKNVQQFDVFKCRCHTVIVSFHIMELWNCETSYRSVYSRVRCTILALCFAIIRCDIILLSSP